jgi:two-component system, response regulator YesN
MKKYNKTLLQIFSAFLLIAAIMSISNYIVFMNSVDELYNQFRDKNKLVVKNMIQSFNECFKDVNDIIYTINTMPLDAIDYKEQDNINKFDAFMIEKELSRLISAKNYIEEAAVFYKESNMAITSKGTIRIMDMFEYKYKNNKYPPEFWKNLASIRHPMRMIGESIYRENLGPSITHDRNLLAVVGSNESEGTNMNVIIFIDVDKLLAQVHQQHMMPEASFMLLDTENNILINIGLIDEFIDTDKIYFGSLYEVTLEKDNNVFDCIKSGYNNFTYINMVSKKYHGNQEIIRKNLLIMLLTMIGVIALAIFLSKKLYKPIKDLLVIMGRGNGEENENKFLQITSGIRNIQRENENFKSQLNGVEYDIRRSIFYKLIDDVKLSKDIKAQVYKYFDMIFDDKKYIMICFTLKENRSEETNISFDNLAVMIQKSMHKHFQNSIAIHTDNMQVIGVIGLEEAVKRDTVINCIENLLLEEFKNVLPRYSMTAAVSRFYSELSEFKSAYKDIKLCMSYRYVKDNKVIIDVEKVNYSYEAYLPINAMERLSNYIISGSGENATGLIEEVISNNVENNISYIKFSHIINNIFDNIVRTMGQHGYNLHEIIDIEQKFFDKMESLNNHKDISKFLCKLSEEASARINKSKQSKLNKDFIIQYMNLHYSEDLYLEKMADITETTPKYFSNYFKKIFGINFVEHLNSIRISHAKEYLKNTDTAISEIGEKVGYANSSTFTITFKKYCGMSPTEFRREYKK